MKAHKIDDVDVLTFQRLVLKGDAQEAIDWVNKHTHPETQKILFELLVCYVLFWHPQLIAQLSRHFPINKKNILNELIAVIAYAPKKLITMPTTINIETDPVCIAKAKRELDEINNKKSEPATILLIGTIYKQGHHQQCLYLLKQLQSQPPQLRVFCKWMQKRANNNTSLNKWIVMCFQNQWYLALVYLIYLSVLMNFYPKTLLDRKEIYTIQDPRVVQICMKN